MSVGFRCGVDESRKRAATRAGRGKWEGNSVTELVLDRARIRSLFDLRSDVYASRGGTFEVDPYPTFTRLRETGPVHAGAPHEELGWTGHVFFQGLPYPNRPHFSAYDYETCARVLQDD